MRVPGRPLSTACSSSSCKLREGAPGAPREVLGRAKVDASSAGVRPKGAVVCCVPRPKVPNPDVAAPSSVPGPPVKTCASTPAGACPKPAVDGCARVFAWVFAGPCSNGPPNNCDISSRELSVGLWPVLNTAPVPGATAPNSRLVTPGDTWNSVSELPNSPLAAASQMTTDTVSPTAILISGGGV